MKTNTLRVAHTADWHLLELQYGRRDRAEDFLLAAIAVINASAAAGCKIIVAAGDLLNKTTMSAGLFDSLSIIEEHLKKHNILLLVITGNHDAGNPVNWFSSYANTLRRVGYISAIVPLADYPEGLVFEGHRIVGFNHCGPEELVQKVAAAPAASLLMIHAALDVVSSGSSSSTSITAGDLPLERFSYVACGDIHIPCVSEIGTAFGRTICAMPGSIELTSAGEPLEKSVFIFDLESAEGQRAEVKNFQTVPIKGNRPVVPIRIETEADVDSAIARLRAAAPHDPIVFVRYNPEIADVRTRLNAILAGTDSIIRMAPYDDGMDIMRAVGRSSGVSSSQTTQASLQEAFGKLCPEGVRYHALAARLLVQPGEVGSMVDAYVTEQLLKPAPVGTL